jgi:hypothetical protein
VKYLLLLNNNRAEVDSWRSLPPEEAGKLREQEIPRWNELSAWAGEEGLELEGLELDDPQEARVVRVRDGEQLVSDGPFAETKEQIGGYFLVDCKDLDQAIEVAERVPSALTGSVEIRPLVE